MDTNKWILHLFRASVLELQDVLASGHREHLPRPDFTTRLGGMLRPAGYLGKHGKFENDPFIGKLSSIKN